MNRVFFAGLILSLGLLIGCGGDKSEEETRKSPGDWRWPESAGADGIQYGEQVRIVTGNFTMGWRSTEPEPLRSNETQPKVITLTQSFYLDKYEVTNTAYRAFVEATGAPDTLIPRASISHGSTGDTPWYGDLSKGNYCVMSVSWHGAIAYANWRSQLEGLRKVYTYIDSSGLRFVRWDRTANGYRLPTEAEWEFAARTQENRIYAWGSEPAWDSINYLPRCAFNALQLLSAGSASLKTQITFGTVGRFRPNNSPFASGISFFGLHDMNGNADEWVWDWYAPYSSSDLRTDPTGPATGVYKAVRGGSFKERDWRSLYNYSRNYQSPSERNAAGGFRLARNL